MSRTVALVSSTLLATAGLVAVGAVVQPAQAADFRPGAGDYVVDTTTLKLTGPGTDLTGVDQNGTAVFSFDDVVVPSGATIRASGSRPFRLVASGAMVVNGSISGNGTNATDFAAGPFAGGPAGGAGGAPGANGTGTGGGRLAPTTNQAGSGGGFGGAGAAGATQSGAVVPGGTAYGPLSTGLRGGSGGGGSASGALTGGGGGGGVVELVASRLSLLSGGVVRADGGAGGVGGGGASGGGSGGTVVLRATTLDVQGIMSAVGGDGGRGGCCANGGAGGGGRIALRYADLITMSGVLTARGGTSGIASSSACCAGGVPGPDAFGATGVVRLVHQSSLVPAATSLTATYGTPLSLSATLRDVADDDAPLADRAVTLWSRAPGGSFTQLGATRTSALGVASLPVSPTAATEYQWRFAGSELRLAVNSAVTSVAVAQAVTAKATTTRPRKGTVFKVYGTVKPAVAGETVVLQRLSGDTWSNVASAIVKRQKMPDGTTKVGFVLSRKAGSSSQKLRVLKGASGGLLEGTSATITIRPR